MNRILQSAWYTIEEQEEALLGKEENSFTLRWLINDIEGHKLLTKHKQTGVLQSLKEAYSFINNRRNNLLHYITKIGSSIIITDNSLLLWSINDLISLIVDYIL
jgi:hypothetical protein